MTVEERFNRIETILERLADRQEQQDDTLTTLSESYINMAELQTRLTESHIKLAEQQTKTEMQVQALGIVVERLSQQTADLERQWQAYLNTLRPQ